MNPFDQFVKRELRCPAYVRYVDDLLLFADNRQALWGWHQAIEERLARFRLTMHAGAQPRPVTEGIPFLGFVVYPQRRRLKRRKGVHFQRKFHTLLVAYQRGDVPLEEMTASVRGWVNHARLGNTMGLRKAVLTRRLIGRPRSGAP